MCLRRFFNKYSLTLSLVSLFFLQVSVCKAIGTSENTPEPKKELDVKALIDHHVLDAYEWEFFKKEDGSSVKISLPRILLNNGKLEFFGSTDEAIEKGKYVEAKEYDKEALHGSLLAPAAGPKLKGLMEEIEHSTDGAKKQELQAELDKAVADSGVMDFSISKNVLFIFIAALMLMLVLTSVARSYKRNVGEAPKGIQSFMEPIIVFVRDDIAKQNIGPKYEKYTPLLLTMFFFIWFLNMLGMIPFSTNVTGNISVTASLALITFVVVTFSGKKNYWKHIFWPPVPHAIKPIVLPIEILGVFTKPFALTIRLFANITGGHIIMVALISLIFIFGKNGENLLMGYSVGIFTSVFLVAISCLELFVALLQAYVFTMLTAVFIGQAVEEADHH